MVLKDEILKETEKLALSDAGGSPRRGRLRRKKSKSKDKSPSITKKKTFDLHSRARRSSPLQTNRKIPSRSSPLQTTRKSPKTKVEDGAAMYEFSLWKGKRKKENVTVSSPGRRKHSPKLPVQNKDVERKVASSSSSVSKVLGNQTGHSCEADMWSVGATVLEMVTAQHPWPEFKDTFSALFHIATSNSGPPVPDSVSVSLSDFFECCFKIIPKERSSAADLINHPFINTSKSLTDMSGKSSGSSSRTRGHGEMKVVVEE